MAAQIVSLFGQSPPPRRDWTQQETAEFYRVESALVQAGIQLESDRGVSDEGDPWFIFCRADNGEVFIHFARIDGFYVVDGVAFEAPARGKDFNALVKSLIATYPVAAARARGNSNIFVHPAALLIALVGAAFFQTNQAKASTTSNPDNKIEARRSSLIVVSSPQGISLNPGSVPTSGEIDASQAGAILLSAILTIHSETVISGSRKMDLAPVPPLTAPQGLAPIETPTKVFMIEGTEQAVAPQIRVAGLLSTSRADTGPQITTAAGTHSESLAVSRAADADSSIVLVTENQVSPTQTASFSAAKPLFFLKFSNAPLPNVEAIAVVTENAILADLVARAMPQVDRLPSSILDLISRGEHLNASAPALPQAQVENAIALSSPSDSVVAALTTGEEPLPQTPTAHQSQPVEASGATPMAQAVGPENSLQTANTLPTPAADSAPPSSGTLTAATAGNVSGPQGTTISSPVTPSSSSQNSSPQTSQTPTPNLTTNAPPLSDPAPAITTAALAKPSAASLARDSAISSAITEFMKYVPHVDMILQGKQLVLYDRDILDPLAGKMDLDSVTINFDDGSSLSLVGTVADLSHFHWPI